MLFFVDFKPVRYVYLPGVNRCKIFVDITWEIFVIQMLKLDRRRHWFEKVLIVSVGAKLSVGSIIINFWTYFCKSCPNDLKVSGKVLLVDFHKLCENHDHWISLAHVVTLFQRIFFCKFEAGLFLTVFTP